MKVINGIIHYTATEVSQLCGVSTQTIKLWNKASEQREEAGEGRLIPLLTLSQTAISIGVLRILRRL